jgi:hypothetical protein
MDMASERSRASTLAKNAFNAKTFRRICPDLRGLCTSQMKKYIDILVFANILLPHRRTETDVGRSEKAANRIFNGQSPLKKLWRLES